VTEPTRLDGLLSEISKALEIRRVDSRDLELYAINTGEFYQTHKDLVGQPIEAWRVHVLTVVVPRYCREIEPVTIGTEGLADVAAALCAYYTQRAAEGGGSNIAPPSRDKLIAAHDAVQAVVGQQFVVLIGNPLDGFLIVGPFPDNDAALRFMETSPPSTTQAMWAAELTAPTDVW